jgi:3-hydroxyisobutyrate dehydrogenase-like beta-hydroxyacid dehydrogenase
MNVVGVVGLGNMGSALAANLVNARCEVYAFDLAGPSRMPAGAQFANDLAHLAQQADVVVLSLPDGAASQAVTSGIAMAARRRADKIIDTSTIGPGAARTVAVLLAQQGIGYVDAPVSGGVASARARTLTVMYAGADSDCDAVAWVLAGLSDRNRRVGDRPGMAQALKLANNFLAATALAATSEAIAFLMAAGLDMAVALEVINMSSGQSNASTDKFVKQVLPGTYAAGFANSLMAKDVRLYSEAVAAADSPVVLTERIHQVWDAFAAAAPSVDFTRIYPYVRDSRPE